MDEMMKNKIIEKTRMKMAVSNFNKEDIKLKKSNKGISKMVATFLLATSITGGLVYATGTAMYEKIWKQPETYEYNYNISESDKEKAISEEEAKKKAEEYLNKIGLSDEVGSLGLTKDVKDDEIIWDIGFTNGSMRIDKKGNFLSLNIPSFKYKIPYNYGITREEARTTAKELLKKYNPENNDDEYELVSLKRNMETDEASYIWYADFYKKYGDLYNTHEKISIGWIPTINGLYSLKFDNFKYENNEQVISKEEAIKIATEKDKTIEKRHNIKTVEAEIGIDKMNTEVVYREKDIENYEKGTINFEPNGDGTRKVKDDAVFYKVDNRVRKVWEVTIFYDYTKYEENGPERFVYYVDCTTGEIIGGARWNSEMNFIKKLKEDPNNFIEK